MHWHFLISEPADGVTNMATDEALMRRAARTGDAVFRAYGWSAPTLSLGRNQRARGCYDLPAASARGVTFVRRPTGGRALLHSREITYSVAMPAAGAADASRAYAFINGVLLSGLAALGVDARRATAAAPVTPGLRPCFDAASEHEIVLGDRKLVGSAQWLHEGALLQHGSILVRDDQPMIAELLTGATPAESAAATLFGALGRDPSIPEIALLLRQALLGATGGPVRNFPWDAELAQESDAIRPRYADDSWTWRR